MPQICLLYAKTKAPIHRSIFAEKRIHASPFLMKRGFSFPVFNGPIVFIALWYNQARSILLRISAVPLAHPYHSFLQRSYKHLCPVQPTTANPVPASLRIFSAEAVTFTVYCIKTAAFTGVPDFLTSQILRMNRTANSIPAILPPTCQ